MASEAINIGKIYADLDINSGNMVRGLAQGERAVKLIEAELRNLDQQLKTGAIDIDPYLSKVHQLEMAYGGLAIRMNDARSAIHSQASAIHGQASALDILNGKIQKTSGAMQGGSHAANRFSMGLMQLGYMVDDIQYGFSSIVNNIAPLVYGLGGSGGLAVTAQITAVAAYQLYNNWDKLEQIFGITTSEDVARLSIEKLGESVKDLQKDVDNFSWGDKFTHWLGVDPDAMKHQELELNQELLKTRQKAVKNADEAENFENPQFKKEKERYLQAVGESVAGVKKEGFKDVTDKIAAKMLEQHKARGGDLSHFMKQNDNTLNPATGEPVTGSKSSKEEYEHLKQVQGYMKLSDLQLSRIRSLESQAYAEIRKQAQEHLGGAAGDIRKAGEIGDMIGGKEGDVIAGRKQTEKGRLESEKETDEYAKQDKELRKKQVKDFIERAVTDLKSISDHLAAKQDRGEITEGARLEQLKDTLWQGNLPDVISMKERDDAAQAEIDRTAEEDPHKRADRLTREASESARKVDPDFQHRADRAAFDVERGLVSSEDARTELADHLKNKGMGEDEADIAIDAEEHRLQKESPQRRAHRMKTEAVSKAEEIVPDLHDTVESAVARGVLSGAGTGKFAADLDKMLGQGGMVDSQERQDAVKGLLDRGQESVRQRMANLATGQGQGEQEHARSEVFSTSQLTAKVQAGVGTDSEPKKQTGLLEKMNTALEKIANKSVVQIEVT